MNKPVNPFPGLRPFNDDEEHFYFGRENQVDAMIDKLAAGRFLAVVGPSGSGKSSLVNCGLRPALSRGALSAAGTSWRIAKFRPGPDPLQSMTRALAKKGLLFEDFPASISAEEVIDTYLQMSKRGLIELVHKARLPAHTNLLVIADQFEELFRYSAVISEQDEAQRREVSQAFVNLLLEPLQHHTESIYIVITMRSDFLGDCAAFEGLPEAINSGQYLVPRMSRKERRASILGPIHVAGADIDPVLLNRLVNDVGDNPDQLSVQQHALNRTWAKWQERGSKGNISLTDYQSIGTMENALDNHADFAYAQLEGDSQRLLASRIFRALTDRSSDVRGIRRPTRFADLCVIVDAAPEQVKNVIEVFRHPSRSFLMPPSPDAIEGDTPIDISHESLMRNWQRLETWTDEEAADADRYRRLAQNAELYEKGHVDAMSGAELKVMRQWWNKVNPNPAWAQRYHPQYELAQQFLLDSEEQDRKKTQRERTIRYTLGGVVSVLAISVIMLGVSQFISQGQTLLLLTRASLLEIETSMLRIPSGSFMMGSDNGDSDELPVHQVTINSFRLGPTEVTFEEYDFYADVAGVPRPDDEGWGRGTRPVVNVSWNDIQGYIEWLNEQADGGYRLPSEAEWEYAARAGTVTEYSWGDDIGDNLANCDGCGSEWDDRQTAPVASFEANDFGLFDMHGNVWEWVQDCYEDNYDNAPNDGSAYEGGDCRYRVLRGGSWYAVPRSLRSADRLYFEPTARFSYDGFRLAQDL